MAAYSYKEVCHRPIIARYVDEFEKNYGREFDNDSNYDGDYWLVASDYIDDLEVERDELLNLLTDLLSVADCDPELSQYPAARAARELLAEKHTKTICKDSSADKAK